MGLDRDALGVKVTSSDHDLVNANLGLGNGSGIEQTGKVSRGSLHTGVEIIELDEVVLRLGMSRSRRPSDKLGKPSVERLLSSLESRAGGPSRPGLLSAHSESAGGALSGGDTASLARPALTGSGGGANVVEDEFEVLHVVDGGFVGRTALPVEELHGEGGGGGGGGGEVHSRHAGREGQKRRWGCMAVE